LISLSPRSFFATIRWLTIGLLAGMWACAAPAAAPKWADGRTDDFLREQPVLELHDLDELFRISRWMAEHPGLYAVGEVDNRRPTVVFINGAAGYPDLFEHFLLAYRGCCNLFIFTYDFLQELRVVSDSFQRKMEVLVSVYQPGRVFVIGHSYGNNVFWQAVLGAGQGQTEMFCRFSLVQLAPTIMGDKRAEAIGFKTGLARFIRFWGAPDFEELVEAVDPRGAYVNAFVAGADAFQERTEVVVTFVANRDPRGPRKKSPEIFKEQYQRYVRDGAFIVTPRVIDGEEEDVHVEGVLTNPAVVQAIGEMIRLIHAAPLEQDPPGGESTIHEVIRLKKAEWNEGRGLEFPEERVEDANLLSSKE
jgi:pimeloyl-ACP methyl ester carboxylesterase